MFYIYIAGGDKRQIMLAEMLESAGHTVAVKGFEKLGANREFAGKPDWVLLPIPYRNPDGFLKAPFSDKKMTLTEITERFPDSAYFLGGCDAAAKKILAGKRWFDVLEDEVFLVRNALLTAEAAVCACLSSTDTALCETRCLVIGYGRIGKFLCRLLKAFSAEVTATARKEKDLEQIISDGLSAFHTADLKYAIPEADVIFNTVPFNVMGERELRCVGKDSRIIELASPPYGMDMELAKNLGVCVQLEQGLPGRYFPVSAARAVLHAFEGESKKWN